MSESDHDRAREIAQDISEGLNCLVSVLQAEKSAGQPPEGCLEALDDMDHAFQDVRDGVRNGVVETDFVADDALIKDVRKVRELVLDWSTTGLVSSALVPLVEEILNRIGINLDALDPSVRAPSPDVRK